MLVIDWQFVCSSRRLVRVLTVRKWAGGSGSRAGLVVLGFGTNTGTVSPLWLTSGLCFENSRTQAHTDTHSLTHTLDKTFCFDDNENSDDDP